MIDQQNQINILVSQLANERIQREYNEKMHHKEINQLNEQFKFREKHLLKKYKKIKKKFTHSLLVIE